MYALVFRIFFSVDEKLVHQLITFFCSVPICHWIVFMRYGFLPQCVFFLETSLLTLCHWIFANSGVSDRVLRTSTHDDN